MAWRSKIRQFISPGQRDGDDDVSIDMGMLPANGNGHQSSDAMGECHNNVVVPINEERARHGLVKFDGEDLAQARVREAEKKYREIAAKLQQEIALRMKAEQALRCLEQDLSQSVELDWKYLEPRLKKAEMEARAREDARERVAKERDALMSDHEGMMVQTQLKNERKLRLKAEQSRAEAEARLLEVEAKIDEAQKQEAEAEIRRLEETLRAVESEASQAEERYKAELARIADDANARLNSSGDLEKWIADAETRAKEAEGKVLSAVLAREEAESKCILAEARANRAEARARGVEPPSAPENMQQALDYLRRALEADPQNIQAILDLSQVSEAIKRLQATSTLLLPVTSGR